MKKNGIPTYNFAVVVDDHFMEITHVLRGDDHISNTPKQLMIYEACTWEAPQFAHMTLIVNEEHKKLSKRDESIIQFIEQYAELGYLPEAMFNFIALLGFHPGGEEEILSQADLIRLFTPERLSKSPAFFDKNKLTWLNNQYIKLLSNEKLAELITPHLIKAERISATPNAQESSFIASLAEIFRDYLSSGVDIIELSQIFFTPAPALGSEEQQILAAAEVPAILEAFSTKIKKIENVTAEQLKIAMKEIQQETGAKGKALFMPIRVAIFGQMHGPDLMKSLELLGKEEMITRLGY
jgi:nondiscriminating glutamyl-tRNA synthetase